MTMLEVVPANIAGDVYAGSALVVFTERSHIDAHVYFGRSGRRSSQMSGSMSFGIALVGAFA
jgi:hypothetical protein